LPSAKPAPPIFIVGSPRSGTTLMRQILDRHPSIAICPETHFHWFVHRRRILYGNLEKPTNRRRVIEDYLTRRPILRSGLATRELAARLAVEATSYQAMFTAILNYYAQLRGKPRRGEKTPRHALFLETLCEWFPDAIILHMLRDPRAAVASLRHEPWFPNSVAVSALRWLQLNQAARRFRGRPGFLEVRYEALVTDPAGELRRVCSLLGEDYVDSMLVPEDRSPADNPAASRSRTAVTAARQEIWRKELSKTEVAQIEWVIGSHLETFGYPRFARPASASTVARGLGYALVDSVRFTASRLPELWNGKPSLSEIRETEQPGGRQTAGQGNAEVENQTAESN
jgi:hypothetical protein